MCHAALAHMLFSDPELDLLSRAFYDTLDSHSSLPLDVEAAKAVVMTALLAAARRGVRDTRALRRAAEKALRKRCVDEPPVFPTEPL